LHKTQQEYHSVFCLTTGPKPPPKQKNLIFQHQSGAYVILM